MFLFGDLVCAGKTRTPLGGLEKRKRVGVKPANGGFIKRIHSRAKRKIFLPRKARDNYAEGSRSAFLDNIITVSHNTTL